MRAGIPESLESQLTTRAAESVAKLLAEASGQKLTVRVTEANVVTLKPVDILALTGLEKVAPERRGSLLQKAAQHARYALAVSWRKQDIAAAAAQGELTSWLGGVEITQGISQEESTPFRLKDGISFEHGSLRWWQMARLLDELSQMPAPGQVFISLEKARQQLLNEASFLGRHGPPAFCTVVKTRGALPNFEQINPYIADVDEKIINSAPVLVEALQELYLTGYLRQRDLDLLLAERARLEQTLQ